MNMPERKPQSQGRTTQMALSRSYLESGREASALGSTPKRGRKTDSLEMVSSALTRTHQKPLLMEIVPGDRKHVNHEVPQATAGLSGFNFKHVIRNSRSFYARESILEIIREAQG
jgi:hypothetical protein